MSLLHYNQKLISCNAIIIVYHFIIYIYIYLFMLKEYKKLKVLQSPTQQCFLYLVSKDNQQFYMYQLPLYDPFQHAFKMLAKFQSINILTLMTTIKTEDQQYFITQIPEPTLLKHQSLLPNKMFEIEQAIKILSQIFSGLFELHRSNYLYLNARPEGIKYQNQLAKLSDFSNAQKISKNRHVRNRQQYLIHQRFLPPEAFQNKPIGVRGEYWIVAVTFYFMLNAEYPFTGNIQQSIQKKCKGGFDYKLQIQNSKNKRIQTAVPDIIYFFRHVFTLNPQKRITQKQLKELEFLRRYFSQQSLSYIREENYEQSAIYSKIPEKSFLQKQILLKMQIITFIQTNAVYIFTETSHVLLQQYRFAFRYALLKLCIVSTNQIIAILESEQAKQYRHTKDYVQIKQRISKSRKIIDMQFKQISLQLQNGNETTKAAKKFLGELGLPSQNTEKSFIQIKKQYRSVTSKLFKIKNQDYNNTKKNKDLYRKTLELLVRIVIFHLINRLFQDEQIKQNLELYYRWHGNSNSIERLNEWFEKETSQNLSAFIKFISDKYL